MILRLVAWTAFAFPLTVLGCGGSDDLPELGTVTGAVTKGGEPLANAWITFVPDKGRLSAGQTDANGEYSLKYTFDTPGAKVGTHTVKIGTGGQQADRSKVSPTRTGGGRQQLFERVGVTVAEGENIINFEVTENNGYKPPTTNPRGRRGRRR